MEIAPGAFHFSRYLDLVEQRALVDRCRALVDGAVPAYVPVVRGGGSMHVRMLCLGRHWNGKTYTYETHRSDFDGLPAPPLPDDLAQLARRIASCSARSGPYRFDVHGNDKTRQARLIARVTWACAVRKAVALSTGIALMNQSDSWR